MSEAIYKERRSMPSMLHNFEARKFLDAQCRAILYSPVMNFSKIVNQVSKISSDVRDIGWLRCALLMIEAALPQGSIDTTSTSVWNPGNAANWRDMVLNATTPGILMGCIILLENNLSNDWLRPNAEHLLSCLPRPWKAINDATMSSVSLRLLVLDRGIKYGLSHDEEDGEWKTVEEEDVVEEEEDEEEEFEE